jgi:LysM repeat protein
MGMVGRMRLVRLSVLAVASAWFLPAVASAAGSHHVQPGETLSGIAAANRLTTATLAAANGLSPNAFVISGTSLTIPSGGSTSAATSAGGGSRHLVAVGDTLSGIALRHGVTPGALASANGLAPDAFVIAGKTLRIPPRSTGTSASAVPAPLGGYRVRLGDTLSGIAAKHGVALSTLAAANGISASTRVIAGTSLRLPATGSATATGQPESAQTNSSSTGPVATGGRLNAAQISSIASQHGAPGSLATAIAWQESGFNNSMRSVANARGIMQVIPSTWDYVQSTLARSPLDPASPVDNVRAGSLLLAHLLRTTGDEATAIAAYYQGLGSVRRIGMLPETRQYVANVQALRSRFGG